MAAPKGNEFWKLRSKHGRDKLFATPEMMWEAACEYFQWCQDNPLKKSEAKTVNIGDYQSRIEIIELPVLRPFTIEGVCHFMDVNVGYFNDFEEGLKSNKALSLEECKDFSFVITRIRETIKHQKFEGAAAGFFNANIIARDLGLVDKKEQNVVTEQPLFGKK